MAKAKKKKVVIDPDPVTEELRPCSNFRNCGNHRGFGPNRAWCQDCATTHAERQEERH